MVLYLSNHDNGISDIIGNWIVNDLKMDIKEFKILSYEDAYRNSGRVKGVTVIPSLVVYTDDNGKKTMGVHGGVTKIKEFLTKLKRSKEPMTPAVTVKGLTTSNAKKEQKITWEIPKDGNFSVTVSKTDTESEMNAKTKALIDARNNELEEIKKGMKKEY
jgi:redox-regulated HSP33 family molecular chaperone